MSFAWLVGALRKRAESETAPYEFRDSIPFSQELHMVSPEYVLHLRVANHGKLFKSLLRAYSGTKAIGV